MKVIVSKTKLNVVDPTPEQTIFLEHLPETAVVKFVSNGATITSDPATLFNVLYVLTCNYDLELV